MGILSPDRPGRRRDWLSRSACLGADPDLFFPVSSAASAAPQVARAKAVCAGCQVRPACLDFALAHRDLQGIWGGTTDEERRKARRSKARRAARAARARQPGRVA